MKCIGKSVLIILCAFFLLRQWEDRENAGL
jgi:hypothetical protein